MAARSATNSDNATCALSIPTRFESIVKQYPERLAVEYRGHALSYGQLNEAANRVAYRLLKLKSSRVDSTAVLFEQGADVISAMLGTLKAGARYCALDAQAPPERINYILDDFQSEVILTNSHNLDLAQRVANRTRTVVNIDEIAFENSSDNPGVVIAPEQIAYVVYTSGSTGHPRGLVRTHQRTAVNAVSHGAFRRLRGDDRLSLLHAVSFSSGDADLYMALLSGAAVLPFSVNSEGIDNLARWLKTERITVFHSAPSLFRELSNLAFPRDHFSDLRLIRLSGAPITREDFDLYRAKFPAHTLLEVGMGSTEAEAICNAVVNQEYSFPKEGSPVGYAREGRTVLILDDDKQELPPGEIGEIAVKSRNFTPGYWRRPELTEEKYLRDPSGTDELIYLTGDWGKMSPDGFVIHYGRKDLMVKIRGYRVDIGEVERALLEHPIIKDAGVAAWDRGPGEKYLAGYVVPRQESALNVSDLNEFLRNELPDYMVPSTFVFLKSLPLANGKLDRRALPLPDHKRPNVGRPYVPAQNVTEQKLIQIWEELLDVFPIGIHDNFFDLGGHSLLASRFVSRLLEAFHLELPLRRVFELPTAASLAEWVETRRGEPKNTRTVPIVSVSREGELPLSFSQQRLWFLDQLEPESCAYNLCSVFHLTGRLNVTALQQSFNVIIKRHEALRTVFKSANGRPFQTILPSMIIEVPIVDLQQLDSATDRDSKIREFYVAEARRPFDLTSGPLLRVALVRLSENEHWLLLTLHHIVFDGWSLGILTRELSALYEAFSNGLPSPLPELSVQYADFSHWQREWLQGEVIKEQIAYWKLQLKGLPTLELPNDRPRLAVQTFRGARQSFALSEALSAALEKLSHQHGVTLFMTLLAAYQTLLQRYTGQNDMAIGSPVAGRGRRELEGLVGFFLNMLVLRTDLSDNPTFLELLARVKGICLDAYEHQDLPFEKLVEELQPQRNMSHTPLFQASFALQNTPACPLELTGLAVGEVDIGSGVGGFDLHLYIVEEQAGLRGWLSYNADLFEAATIARMVGHLRLLLEGAVANPDQRVSDLPMLTEAEKHRLLVEWNDTKTVYPKDKCIQELFETQVDKTPEAIAVVFEDQQLTYRELNYRANQLARYLRRHGVGPGVLVGICVARSMEMVIGLLGILKAGGGYVPLDPSYPTERLEFMLADAQVPVLLTQEGLLEDGGSRMDDSDCRSSILDRPMQRISLDRDWELIARESNANPESTTTADNLAYVIYTSGSTGQPKGVAIEHRNTVAFLSWAHFAFGKEELSGVLASTSICFDLSVFEIFAPLTCGGTIIIAKDALALTTIPNRSKVSLVNTVPSAINELLRRDAIPPSVLVINLAGEPLSPELVQRIYESTSVQKVHDLYGPSESTTYSTWMCRSADGPQTIGRPIANSRVYILDAHRNPVPIGVVGEIYIGGDGVARGYLNRPQLTAERFIGHSFDGMPEQRLYKTGDLARYLPDGNVQFIGRADTQVKIRGYRIELGEIETVLGQHSSVQSSAVMVREDTSGDKRLVAYVVAQPQASFDLSEMRKYLKQKLPEYMIPSALVALDELPLTPNGKVDRRALPMPDQNRPDLVDAYQAPRTPLEDTLARIWAELLKVDKVGIRDNFFDLGGHSLLATQIVSRVRSCLSTELPLRTLFESPTIEQMAGAVYEAQGKAISDGGDRMRSGLIEPAVGRRCKAASGR